MARAVLAACCLYTAGCAYLPGEMGLPSVERDMRLGHDMAVEAERSLGLVKAPALETYIGAVGERLASGYPGRRFQYTFRIIDQPDPNAFAVMGGAIYVTRGLLALTGREEELAGVLAHEISHVEKRHSAKNEAKARLPALLALPGRIVGGVVDRRAGELLCSPFEILGALGIARFSRSQEFEADDIGARLAASAGYSPLGLPRLLARLALDHELETGRKEEAGFLDSHPMTPDRISELEAEARGLSVPPRPPIVPDAGTYMRMLDGLVVGPDPADGIFKGRMFLHPDLRFHMEFPEGWKTVNTPRAAGAIAPDQDALLLVTSPIQSSDPVQVGRESARAIESDTGRSPDRSGSTELNGLPAYQVEYVEHADRTSVRILFIWVACRGAVLPFLSIGGDRHQESAQQALRTFGP
ncbi:MAG TPA: M48 family metalloprotease, partial [Rectinemataceae bacterium]|nr:M48 family metalloprotease [Rectinemataceae bacterium]